MKIIVFFTAFLFTTIGFSQGLEKDEVPSLVVNNFKKQFPKANDIEWEKHGELFEVEFDTKNGEDNEAWFNKEGKIIKQKTIISKEELTKPILLKLEKEFPNYKITEVEQTIEHKVSSYEIELKNDTQEWEIVMDSKGNIITKKID